MTVQKRYIYTITDTYFQWVSVDMPPKVRRAICLWLEFHGIDPNRVPQMGVIKRIPDSCQIVYIESGTGTDKNVYQIVVEQGEAPPLPWPREILDLVRESPLTTPSR